MSPSRSPAGSAAPKPARHEDRAPSPKPTDRRAGDRPRSIGGAAHALVTQALIAGGLGPVTAVPIQPGKVQPPPLHEQLLARDRLLDWLAVKIHRRIVLVLAEAGYGKTALLADFSARTRIRTLWYRLDAGDRDWVVFANHLVAAVRVRLPDACQAAASLLTDVGPAGPTMDVVLEALVRGLADLPDDPSALILDDFHLVEDSPDIRRIVRELLARAPERLTLVFVSRRIPSLPFARRRAQGEVAELRTADLRFDEAETERLFRDAYAMPLEPGVAAELTRRTEGWAASLQLVQTAIRERSPAEIRAFVRSLSGAEGELYEYLAEEVVGDLGEGLQRFLMRTAVLETVEPVLASVAADVSEDDARALIEEGELVGLLARRAASVRHTVRAHPLVRDFLIARLNRSLGTSGVAGIHRAVARAAEPLDWESAGRHYLAAGDLDDLRRVLHASIDSILASGAYGLAGSLVAALPEADGDPVALVIRSREALQRGDDDAAVELADRAASATPGAGYTALTAMTARFAHGDLEQADRTAKKLSSVGNPIERRLGRAVHLMLQSSIDGHLDDAIDALESVLAAVSEKDGSHYRGVARSNLALFHRALGRPLESVALADQAMLDLAGTTGEVELVSARLVRGWGLAHLGRLEEARMETERARIGAVRAVEADVESADVEVLYGDARRAATLLTPLPVNADADLREQRNLVASLMYARDGAYSEAAALMGSLRHGHLSTTVAQEARRLATIAHLACAVGAPDAPQAVDVAEQFAATQGAAFWVRYCRSLRAAISPVNQLSAAVIAVCEVDSTYISLIAELFAPRLHELTSRALGPVRSEVQSRPDRWRTALRRAIDVTGSAQLQAAALLEDVGEVEDVARLRTAARATRGARGLQAIGRRLARRLADRIWVEDLGRVSLRVGKVTHDGAQLRRKVLALLCLLLTKPRFAATREEVLETLWPDLEPDVAMNSLNQTVYFLRRIFEPEYKEETSPGYLQQDIETVWLDQELVDSRARYCHGLLRAMPANPSPDDVWQLMTHYRGKFALDFAYEDWAAAYRESLHAGFLRVAEGAIRVDLDTGHFDRGIVVAQRALDVEPEADELQAALVRLYRFAGVYTAAAEQYSHYSVTMRHLGVEPPDLADV